MPHPSPRAVFALALLLPFAGCAEGGKEDRPQSEVRFLATHHLFGFRALRGFGTFPVPSTAVLTDFGTLKLFTDSTYTVTRANGTTAPDRYALEDSGDFSVFVSGTNRDPSVVFRGAYGRVGAADLTTPGANPDFFFTDRVSTESSPSIGLYVGTRILQGQVELAGGWHVLSLHSVFGQTIPSPDNVGRAARGGITIAAGAPGTSRLISGTGTQGTSSLVFGGSIQNLLDTNGVGDGTCNLILDYTLTGQPADVRPMLAAANANIVFGLDAEESDGEAGLLFLVRKFDTPVDSVRVPGRFLVGGETLFVNPTNSGSDAFVGVVTLTAQGGFRLDAVGNSGQDFTYQGTWTLAADGGLTLAIAGTNETWFAAIDRAYNTFLFVDDFREDRPNDTPELNLGFGVREKTN